MKGIYQKSKMKLIFWMARRLPDCQHMTPLFSDSLDRKLSVRERVIVRLHFFTCNACQNYLANLKFMRKVFQEQEKRFEEEKISVSLSPEARDRLKNALKSTQS